MGLFLVMTTMFLAILAICCGSFLIRYGDTLIASLRVHYGIDYRVPKVDLVINSQQSLLSVDPELLPVRKELFHLPFLLLVSLSCQVLDEEPGEFFKVS